MKWINNKNLRYINRVWPRICYDSESENGSLCRWLKYKTKKCPGSDTEILFILFEARIGFGLENVFLRLQLVSASDLSV